MKIMFRTLTAIVIAASFSIAPGISYADSDGPSPVLMVISNQDFWYEGYSDTRASLEAQGLDVVVAAATTETSRPHANSGQGSDGGFVQPDIALADVEAEDYSGIVFSGGWGMAQYQYGFEGTYDNSAYQRDPNVVGIVNNLIGDFIKNNKHVAAICHGVSVLAWARVDGESPLKGRNVVAWAGGVPGYTLEGQQFADNSVPARREVEANGASMLLSAAPGDPLATEDDVIVDGRIITAENYNSATLFGETIAEAIGVSPKKRRPRLLRPRKDN